MGMLFIQGVTTRVQLVINLVGAAKNAIFNKEGLHLSWFAQFTMKRIPCYQPTNCFLPGFTAELDLFSVIVGAEGPQGCHLSGEVIRKDFGSVCSSHSLYLAIYAKLRLRNSLYKTRILCLVFWGLGAIPLGKNYIRHGALGHQALIWPSQLCHKAWEYPHGSFCHDSLHVEEAVHRKCSSFSCGNMGI